MLGPVPTGRADRPAPLADPQRTVHIPGEQPGRAEHEQGQHHAEALALARRREPVQRLLRERLGPWVLLEHRQDRPPRRRPGQRAGVADPGGHLLGLVEQRPGGVQVVPDRREVGGDPQRLGPRGRRAGVQRQGPGQPVLGLGAGGSVGPVEPQVADHAQGRLPVVASGAVG